MNSKNSKKNRDKKDGNKTFVDGKKKNKKASNDIDEED